MSEKQFELDQKTFQRDLGTIVLYRRPDHKNPRWNCRLSVADVPNQYVRKSCRTTDLEEALRFAENELRSAFVKSQQTGSIKSKSFRKVVHEYLRDMKHSNKRQQTIDEYRDRLDNYAVRHFGNRSIDQISSADISTFVQWRREFGIRKRPADSTIAKELAPLKQVFDYAVQKKYIGEKPLFPKLNGKGKIRPHFNRNEYARLTRNLREWVKEAKDKHPRAYRDRYYLQQYILVLANCGCRIGEIRNLRWRNIEKIKIPAFEDKQELEEGVSLEVFGKTGKRQVIAQSSVKVYLERLKKFRTAEMGQAPPADEFVFCHKDGSRVGSYRKGFDALLQEYDLVKDVEGNRHTLYSLRHTYAVFRISEEVNHYLLATNMGTSVQMLQRHYLKLTTIEHAREITKSRRREKTTKLTAR